MDEQDTAVLRDAFAEEVTLMKRETTLPIDAILANLQTLYDACPDLRHIIHEVWVDDDTAVVHYTNVGTFEEPFTIEEGPMAGLHAEPTDEEVEYFGVYLVRFDDGEIVEWMNYPERLQVFQQLGIVSVEAD